MPLLALFLPYFDHLLCLVAHDCMISEANTYGTGGNLEVVGVEGVASGFRFGLGRVEPATKPTILWRLAIRTHHRTHLQ